MQTNADKAIVKDEQITNTSSNSEQTVEKMAETKKAFKRKVILYNAIACSDNGENFDRAKAFSESQNDIEALSPQDGLQEMLIAQMTSIHLLQQKTIALANRSGLMDTKQYLTNSAIKLANCFTQQAVLLAKLQGTGGQKIIVEHVEVHQGGQAVVANIQGATQSRD
jgi:hypothetical protein